METREKPGVEQHLADESALWQARDTDPRAREELTNRYLPYARSLAARYRSTQESFDDLLQVACVGLVNAVDRFEPERGKPFTSFASPTILGELKRYFRDRVWMVRVPRSLQETIKQVETASNDLGADLHREPTRDEIAERSGLDQTQLDDALMARQGRVPVSLDQPIDQEGHTSEERVGEEDASFDQVDKKVAIREAAKDLSSVERRVLRLRFIEDMTQSEIAERIGYSQMHVSRMLRRSLDRLDSGTVASA